MKTIRIIRSERVVTPEGVKPATVHIDNGVIASVSRYDDLPPGGNVYDVKKSVVMPGLIDTHVHINEPGRTEWEGFETATRAAAAGGVTTLIDMPLNSIPATTTSTGLEAKRAAARGKCWVNVGFWGGVVPGNSGELQALRRAGVFGFKCFLVPSGVSEFEPVTATDLRETLPKLAAMDVPLLIHAELPGPIERAANQASTADPRKYASWLLSRPPEAEHEAISLMIDMAREFSARIHIVHLSSAGAVGMLLRAKREKLRVTVETCPHYLAFDSNIRDGCTEFKCAPPIRESKNRDDLWTALGKGTIDLIASDHSPSPPAMKCSDTGDFFAAWGGISSLQLGLPIIWTEASKRDFSLAHAARWMCSGPATLAGLEKRKGSIQAGYDADIVVWNPEKEFTVKPSTLYHRHKLTPYKGKTFRGTVEATFLRGEMVYEHGAFVGEPAGTLLRRGDR